MKSIIVITALSMLLMTDTFSQEENARKAATDL